MKPTPTPVKAQTQLAPYRRPHLERLGNWKQLTEKRHGSRRDE